MRSEILLQRPDVAPQRRRQHVQALRRAAKMQVVGGGQEAAKLVQFHPEFLRPDYIIYLYKPLRIELDAPAS